MTIQTLPEKIATILMRVIMQMPDPLPRFFLDALHKEVPELRQEIERIQRRSVPFLKLHESRRTTMHGPEGEGTIRFSSVLITGETDNGQLVCWPQFMIGSLPQHDRKMLELSLTEWLAVLRKREQLEANRLTAAVKTVTKMEDKSSGEGDLL